jgi:hypothetical protein
VPTRRRKRKKTRQPRVKGTVGKKPGNPPLAKSWFAGPAVLAEAEKKARELGSRMENRIRGLLKEDRMGRRNPGNEKKTG